MNVKAKIPTHFAYCPKSDCPKAKECLHHLACEQLTPNIKQVLCVNPVITQQANEQGCSELCEAKTVRMARGFINALGTVPAGNMSNLKAKLFEALNRSYFYRMRRGDLLISPPQQQVIVNAITKAGGKTPVEFDHYEEGYIWE